MPIAFPFSLSREPVAYDAVGSGTFTGSFSSSPATFTVTHVAAANATLAVVWVEWIASVTGIAISSYTTAATFGGVSMTSVGVIGVDNLNIGSDGVLQGFVLLNPPTGSQTVNLTVTRSGDTIAAGMNSVTYTGVGSYGSAVTNSGQSAFATSGSISSAPAHRIAQAFGANFTGNFSSYSHVSRYANHSGNCALNYGDSPGVYTDSFAAALTNNWWASIGFDMAPP
jgi:hypothetical protein